MTESPAVIARLNAALEGRYEIEKELGEGGMATVYLAQDLKHNRKVALKVLRPELAAVVGAERFLGEIETTANLQHPHILPLFDSGEADTFLFYVMPWVEGESLRERIQKEHQLPIEEALEITENVAAALQYAHEQGVVHRDIKPANILLSRGKPLVADFGIALALSEAGGGRITETGLSLGTPHYMSPEQAAGERSLDVRSDVYALGCVLYEMLTGQPPYGGPTAQAVLGRILTGEPTPPTELRKAIPVHVEHAILKALEKLPADRFESAAELVRALETPSFRHGVAAGGRQAWSAAPTGWRRWAPMAGVGAVAFLAGVAVWAAFGSKPLGPTLRQRISLVDPTSIPDTWLENYSALQPNGDGIVFADTTGSGESNWILWWKAGDRADPVPLPNTGEAQAPTFSPDGEWLAFMVGNELRKQPLLGGTSVLLSDSAGGGSLRGLAWLDDGTIIFEDQAFGLRRIPEDGGASEVLYTRDQVGSALQISGLRGGGGFLLVGCQAGTSCPPGTAVLQVADLKRDTIQRLADDVMQAWNVRSDRIVYVDSRGAVYTALLDRKNLSLGSPTPLFDGVQATPGNAEMLLDTDGSILYRRGEASTAGWQVVWVDRTGRFDPVDPDWSPANLGDVALSPDGGRLAVTITPSDEEGGGPERIWIKELPDGPLTPLTTGGSRERRPVWIDGGRSIAYIGVDTARAPPVVARTIPADGSTSNPESFLTLDRPIFEVLTAADGRTILFRTGNTGQDSADVGYVSRDDPDEANWLLSSRFNENGIQLSPDGRWLAYVSDVSGRQEVFVRPFPGEGGRVQVSRNGGTEPVWAHSGKELFYRDGEGWVSVAAVETGGPFRVTSRERLFDASGMYSATPAYHRYDVSPDDERFLMLRFSGGGEGTGDLVLVENWFPELNRIVKER